MGAGRGEKPDAAESSPLVIVVSAPARDGEVICALLRTILEGDEPYEHVGLLSARELYDGRDWRRLDREDPAAVTAELAPGRLAQHLAHARTCGLSYLLVQTGADDSSTACGGTELLPDLVCALGAGGSGTVRAGARGLSFSARSPMADVGARDVRGGYGLTRFTAVTPAWEDTVAVPLTGRFNVAPALAAIAVCVLLGIDEGAVATGLLLTRVTAHGSLIVAHEQRLFALIEDSSDPRDGERLAAAAREEYPDLAHEVVRGASDVGDAVRRAAAREGRTMLTLLGAPADRLEDALQNAVRQLG